MISEDLTFERKAFNAVLASNLFAHGSNADRFLRYVGDKYFEGNARSINEYAIGVEALGRSSKFDPRHDAIVRVEAHRVRQRLRQYYENKGNSERVQMVLPPGTYIPQFVTVDPPVVPPQLPLRKEKNAPPDKQTTAAWRLRLVLLMVIILGLAAAVIVVKRGGFEQEYRRPSANPSLSSTAQPGETVRVLAGSDSAAYTDSLGQVWEPDRFFQGGVSWLVSYRHIARTSDPKIFLSMRQGRDFAYYIPLPRIPYEMRLLFAETVFGDENVEAGGESSRMFDVLANGASILTDFDPLSDADGENVADVRVFKDIYPAADGRLHLRFLVRYPVKQNAFVNAIELVPGTKGIMRPLRWVASSHPFEDGSGKMWLPDRFFLGGRLRTHQEPIGGTADPESFRSERFGHFTYSIPVAPGSYRLTLKFAETWFGTTPAGTRSLGTDSRLFDVYCNGMALLRNFDIAREAGGPDRALVKTFHGLKPNAQGKLVLSFVPIKNYASVNAIEVGDEADKSDAP